VICTELPGNQGESVANAVEQLAAAAIARWGARLGRLIPWAGNKPTAASQR
jgi:hypothetical protein